MNIIIKRIDLYKVSENELYTKRKWAILKPIIGLLALGIVYAFEKNFGFFFLCLFFLVLITPYQDYKEIKHLKALSLKILPEGVCINDTIVNHILPFEKISKIKLFNKDNKMKKLILIIDEKEENDLSSFEKLEQVNEELEKYLPHALWEKN